MLAAQHLFQEWIASSQALRAIVPRNDGLERVLPLIFSIRHPSTKYNHYSNDGSWEITF